MDAKRDRIRELKASSIGLFVTPSILSHSDSFHITPTPYRNSFSVTPHLSREALPLSARLTPRAPRVASRRSLSLCVTRSRSLRAARVRSSISVNNRAVVARSRSCATRGLSGSAGSGSLSRSGSGCLLSRGLRGSGSARRNGSGGSGRVGRSAARDAGSRAGKAGEELPSGLGSEVTCGGTDVTTVPGDEGHGLGAAFEVGADVLAAAGRRLSDLLGLAAVVLDERVGELNAAADGEDIVADTVDTEVGDGVLATLAAGDQTAGDGRDGTEVASLGASDGVGHAAAVGEASGEALSLVDAKVGLDLLDDGLDEGDVTATLVGPAIVDTVGGDEDGRALGESVKAVPLRDAVAVDDITHGASKPVEAEDQAIGVAGVIIVRDLESVFTTIDVLNAGLEGGLTAATTR